MKKYPKLVQVDKRGQIVIPKDIRADLKIDEATGFWVYSIGEEGILLKKVETPEFSSHKRIVQELEEKAEKIGVKKSSIARAKKTYKKTREGNLEVV